MTQILTYHVERGAYFQRLIVVKDRRTHHVSPCTSATFTLTGEGGDYVKVLTTAISSEGGVVVTMTQAETLDLLDGVYTFEVLANPYTYGYSSWGGIINPPYPPITQTVAVGTLTVVTLDPSRLVAVDDTVFDGGAL